MDGGLQADIEAVGTISAVPTILDVVCRVTGMGFAAVARVTEQRWICCAVNDLIQFGLQPGGELKVETTICHEVREMREPVVIDHVAEDSLYCRHHTPAMYGFQSYISMPIVLKDGRFFGTLCAIDPQPRRLKNPETIGMFKLFAELIAFHLDAGARLLQKTPLNEKATAIVTMMQDSVRRMAKIIDNVMDLARGRLGGGIALDRAREPLGPVLDQVVAEARLTHPERAIDVAFDLAAPVDCDRSRIARLFSNLLGNALLYGKADAPVTIRASTRDGTFELSVANAGDQIPAAETPARQVHHIVDDLGHAADAVLHHRDDGRRLLVQRRLLQQPRAGIDRGERIAQIVTQHRDEMLAQLGILALSGEARFARR